MTSPEDQHEEEERKLKARHVRSIPRRREAWRNAVLNRFRGTNKLTTPSTSDTSIEPPCDYVVIVHDGDARQFHHYARGIHNKRVKRSKRPLQNFGRQYSKNVSEHRCDVDDVGDESLDLSYPPSTLNNIQKSSDNYETCSVVTYEDMTLSATGSSKSPIQVIGSNVSGMWDDQQVQIWI